MLDKVLSHLKEEIGIDGIQGSNISTVWNYLQDILNSIAQENGVSTAPVVDDSYKGYLWEFIKAMDNMTFYIKHDTPVIKKTINKKEKVKVKDKKSSGKKRKVANDSDDDYEGGGPSSSSEEEEMDDLEGEDEEEEKQEIKKPTDKRKNGNIEREPKKSNENIVIPDQNLDSFEKVNVSDLTYAEVNESFGDKLHIIASQEVQDQQLYHQLPPDCNLSPNVSIFLREILKCRSAGFYQAYLTKHFNLDARATGHYCKVLEEKGAITRQRVTIKGFYTNVCTHIRFKHSAENGNTIHTSETAPYNMNSSGEYITVKDICATIIELAKDANERTIMARDVLYALGFESNKKSIKKWFNRCIHDLYESGYIKKLKTQVNGQGPMLRCIQLLKDSMDDGPKDITVTEQIDFPINVESAIAKRAPTKGTYIDIPVSRQVFLNIENAQETGITQKEIAVALNSVNNRLLYRYLELLSSKTVTNYDRFYICRHIEFEKRVRRYRYFTLKNYKRINDKDENYSYPELPESEFNEAKLFELNSKFDFEHNRKAYVIVLRNSFREPSATAAKVKRMGRPPKKSKQNNERTATTAAATTAAATTTPTTPTTTTITTKKTPRRSTRKTKENASTQSEIAPPEETKGGTQSTAAVSSPSPTEDATMDEPESSAPGPSNEAEADSYDEPIALSKVPVSCKFNKTRSSALVEQGSSQDSTNDGRSSSSKRSAFGILMASSRTAGGSRNRLASPSPSQQEPEEIVSMIKIPPSSLMKAKKPACAQAAAAAATEETDTIIATENIEEEEEIRASTKRKTRSKTKSQPTRGLKKTKTSNEPVEAISSQSSDSQPKKKSLFDYFGKSKSTPVNKEQTPPPPPAVEETEPMDIEGAVNEEQKEDDDDEWQENEKEEEEEEEQEEQEESIAKAPKERPFTQEVFTDVESFKKYKRVNRYMELRKKTLLALLETEPVFISNKAFMKKYVEAYNKVSNSESSHMPQKKTILSAAKELEKEGQAQIKHKSVKTTNGSIVDFFVVVRKDMDLEGKQFKEIYDNIGYEKSFHGTMPQLVKIPTLYSKVERLDDRLEKIKKALEEKRKTITPRQMGTIESNIDRYASNARSITKVETSYTSPTGTEWRNQLLRTGFISSKMYRTKEMHKHILNIWLEQGDIVNEDSIDLPSATIVGKMTTRLYLRTIGLRKVPTNVKEFICDPANENRLLEDYPQDIITLLLSGNSKWRFFLRMLLNILTLLGFVEPEENKSDVVQRVYRIKKTVELYDLRYKKEFTDTSIHTVTDEQSFSEYWDALKYLATLPHKLVTEHLAPRIENDFERANLTSIYTGRAWVLPYTYTPEQTDLLNSYCDIPNFKTPISDLDLCAKIAQLTHLPVDYVHKYYTNLQSRLDYQGEKKTNIEIKQAMGIPLRVKRNKSGRIRGTGIVSKGNIERHRYCSPSKLKVVDDKNLPTVDAEGGIINFEQFKKRHSKRILWTDQEDEILMYCYIIIRSRITTNSDFRWSAAIELLPNRTANSCRNRFDRIIMMSKHRERIISYERLWAQFYKEGIQNGDIVDENPDDPNNFDVISFMEYFIIRLNESHSSNTIDLPSTIGEMGTNFTITPIRYDKSFGYIEYPPVFFTAMGKKRHLLRFALCSRINRGDETDSPLNAFKAENTLEGRQERLIRLFSFLSMYVPNETYNPIEAYRLIYSYPKELRNYVFAKMRKEGVLVKSKRERSIPTTQFTIASKCIHNMFDKYPATFYTEAQNIETQLNYSKKISFDPIHVYSGSMACLLSLASQKRLDITVPNREEQMQKFEYMNSRSKNIRIDMAYFDINIGINDHSPPLDNPALALAPEHQDTLVIDWKDSVDADFSQTISSQLPQHQHAVANSIVEYLKDRGEKGASPYEIKLHVSEVFSDKDIVDCLAALEKSSVINSVGINAERYVLSVAQFLESWTFKVKCAEPNDTDKNEVITNPTIWTNLQGAVTPVVFNECTKKVVGLVLRKPGITETGIFRSIDEILSRKEIRIILRQLVEKKVIKVFKISRAEKPAKHFLFSKPRSMLSTKQNIIAECSETSYWPTPNYYLAIA